MISIPLLKGEKAMRMWSILGTILIALVAVAVTAPGKSNPAIRITDVPHYDERGGSDRTEIIKGTASGITDCHDCKVVLFARTNKWWVQPRADSPYTPIVGGKWQSETYLGKEYAALLVRPSYKAPATAETLPTIGTDILAVDSQAGRR